MWTRSDRVMERKHFIERYTMINFQRTSLLLLLVTLLSGCAATKFDKVGAMSLSIAGQAAAHSLQQQAAQVSSSLEILPMTISVKEILDCRGVRLGYLRTTCIEHASSSASGMEPQRKALLGILEKRQKALKALGDAYLAFGDFANYDAGKETAQAVETAFGKINTLTGSLNSLLPVGMAIAPITATITKVLGGLGAISADNRQAELMLATSKDLHTAVDAMIRVLKSEEDFTAMRSLMVELQDEQDRLEKSTLEAGLASSMSVLGPFYSKVAPDITLTSSPLSANVDLATASAKQVLAQTMSSREKVIESAYDQAVTALSAVSAEHQKLESNQGVNVSLILAEVQHLRDIIQTIGK